MRISIEAFEPHELEYDEARKALVLRWLSPKMEIVLGAEYIVSLVQKLPPEVRDGVALVLAGQKGPGVLKVPGISEETTQWKPEAVEDSAQRALYESLVSQLGRFTESVSLSSMAEAALMTAAAALVYDGQGADDISELLIGAIQTLEPEIREVHRALHDEPTSDSQVN